MKSKNKITDVTRRHIADEMTIGKIWYHGNQSEPDFLARLFDLKSLPSRDYRYTNAYDDIYQHMVNNNDWEIDWIYSDPRINLLYCADETYLTFLSMTVHPRVRTNSDEVVRLIEIYNKHLFADGFEIAQTDEISGKPIFSGRQKAIGQAHLVAKKIEIKRYLNTANSTYPKVAVQWLNQALCFYQSLCLVDSEVLRNRHLRVAAKPLNVMPHCKKTDN
jgi:hypothetical protein